MGWRGGGVAEEGIGGGDFCDEGGELGKVGRGADAEVGWGFVWGAREASGGEFLAEVKVSEAKGIGGGEGAGTEPEDEQCEGEGRGKEDEEEECWPIEGSEAEASEERALGFFIETEDAKIPAVGEIIPSELGIVKDLEPTGGGGGAGWGLGIVLILLIGEGAGGEAIWGDDIGGIDTDPACAIDIGFAPGVGICLADNEIATSGIVFAAVITDDESGRDIGDAEDGGEGRGVVFTEAASAGEEEFVEGIGAVSAWFEGVGEVFLVEVEEDGVDEGAIIGMGLARGVDELAEAGGDFGGLAEGFEALVVGEGIGFWGEVGDDLVLELLADGVEALDEAPGFERRIWG